MTLVDKWLLASLVAMIISMIWEDEAQSPVIRNTLNVVGVLATVSTIVAAVFWFIQ